MRLVPFTLDHADLVASWAPTRSDLDAWASLERAPTPESFARWLADPEVHAHLLIDDQPLAYGELWVSQEEDEVELARLLVAPEHRNQGVGRRLAQELLRVSREIAVSSAWVRVVPDNLTALRCYTAAGFAPTSLEHERELNVAQPRAYRWLRTAL